MEFQLADSGEREQHATGAVRDTRAGKGRFDLISPVAKRRLAQWYEKGAMKYTDRNWEKGMPLSRFLDSAMRHLNDYAMVAQYRRDGIPLENLPPDVNPYEDHLSAAMWNIAAIIHFEELRPELDDLGQVNAKVPNSVMVDEQPTAKPDSTHDSVVQQEPETDRLSALRRFFRSKPVNDPREIFKA